MRQHLMAAALLVVASILLSQIDIAHAATWASDSSPRTVTLGFDGVTDGAFLDYKQNGFGVRARTFGWMGDAEFGDPAPFIDFTTPAGVKSTQSVIVTHHGQAFTFKSIDIYSSITTIPYKSRGSLNGLTKYVVTGTVPNTFGGFATVTNPKASTMIDRLVISVTNPVTCCSNPMGIIDNISVVKTMANDT